MKRPWLVMSSSSGRTFEAVWQSLSSESRAACLGMVTDRACGAVEVATKLGLNVATGRKDTVETIALHLLGQRNNAIILLCGYFSLLSESFLKVAPAPVVNTHPSLLPAFPGLDKKVHAEVAAKAALGGFTVHLVTDALDGGPILFQHPVQLTPGLDDEAVRETVRKAEQKWLGPVFEQILGGELDRADARLNTRDVRKKNPITIETFREVN